MQLSTIVKPLKEAEKTLELCRPDSTSVYLIRFWSSFAFYNLSSAFPGNFYFQTAL